MKVLMSVPPLLYQNVSNMSKMEKLEREWLRCVSGSSSVRKWRTSKPIRMLTLNYKYFMLSLSHFETGLPFSYYVVNLLSSRWDEKVGARM